MIRGGVSLLAGAALALLLFWGLALLVAPPEPDVQVEAAAMRLSLVQAPDRVTGQASPSAVASLPEPLPPVEPAPATIAPEPVPLPDSRLALPDPEPLVKERETLAMEETLPALREQAPTRPPDPEPAPDPDPETTSAPESTLPTGESASQAPAGSATPAFAGGEPQAEQGASVDPAPAMPTRRVPPDYPSIAQRRGLEGHVQLEFLIRPDGRVDPSSIRVVEARPSQVFDRAARRAISQWRFEASGQRRRVRQRLEFQLR
ncbi:energy transducer TonB [Halomonas aquatica]|uniref:Protein TonB n=1 Tax=Halomonas aquatica TaxID=3151123 RepID=A0ABV1NGS8_9GAMM